MMPRPFTFTVTAFASLFAAALLSACGSMSPMKPMYSQAGLPAAVQVPAGNKVAMETVGVGEITYQCSPKKDMAGQFEWVFAGPDAKLNEPRRQAGRQVLRPARHLGSHGRLQD